MIHLVRAANGPDAVERFLASYERHEAGMDHELVLVLKGFDRESDADGVVARAARHGATFVRIPDDGLDLDAYAAVSRASTHEHLCFLNSHSEVLADGWLDRLVRPVVDGRAGVVGATGSWASHLGYGMWQAGLSGGYASRGATRSEVRSGVHEALGAEYGGDLGNWVLSVMSVGRSLRRVPRFPNAHLRTNAFALRRDVFDGLKVPHPLSKHDAHLIESGRRSLTRHVVGLGLPVLVADRAGQTWAPEEWADADVLWQRDQSQLLIADNQTRTYAAAGQAGRRALAFQAWGGRARL